MTESKEPTPRDTLVGARPIPLAPLEAIPQPHRPWCQDCKRKVELGSDGLCDKCRRARGNRQQPVVNEQVWRDALKPKKKPRPSRAKNDPMPHKERGKLVSRTTKVPPSERAAMASLYSQGVSLREIGRRLNRHNTTVRKVLTEDGVTQ